MGWVCGILRECTIKIGNRVVERRCVVRNRVKFFKLSFLVDCYPSVCRRTSVGCWPTPSFAITLAGVPSHVSSKFVSGNISHLHFVTNPLPAIPLVPLVPEATVLRRFWVRLASRELFAVWAWVGWMARVAALVSPLAAASAATSVVAFLAVPPTVTLAIVVVSVVGGGVAVGLYSGGALGVFSVGCPVLLLKELGEQGDLVGYGVGGAGGCWSVVEFSYAVGASKFLKDGGDGGGVVRVVVGVLAADGLKCGAEFTAPIVAGRDVDVGEEDEG